MAARYGFCGLPSPLRKSSPRVVVGERMAGARRLLEQLGRLGAILLDAAPFGIEDAERERCLHVAELVGARVPLGGRLRLLADAEPLRIEAAEQRVRLRIVALDAFVGELHGREVLALVEGDVGGFVAGRRHQRLGVGALARRRRALEGRSFGASGAGASFTGLPRLGFGASVVSITQELVSARTGWRQRERRRARATGRGMRLMPVPRAVARRRRGACASVLCVAGVRSTS